LVLWTGEGNGKVAPQILRPNQHFLTAFFGFVQGANGFPLRIFLKGIGNWGARSATFHGRFRWPMPGIPVKYRLKLQSGIRPGTVLFGPG
jgi:hypothetical protein